MSFLASQPKNVTARAWRVPLSDLSSAATSEGLGCLLKRAVSSATLSLISAMRLSRIGENLRFFAPT